MNWANGSICEPVRAQTRRRRRQEPIVDCSAAIVRPAAYMLATRADAVYHWVYYRYPIRGRYDQRQPDSPQPRHRRRV